MVARRALVLVDGIPTALPAGDTLQGTSGGGGLAGVAVLAVPAGRGVLEHVETVAAAGVGPGMTMVATVAPHDDAEENDPEMLDVMALAARAGTGDITFTLALATPTAGPVRVAWAAF